MLNVWHHFIFHSNNHWYAIFFYLSCLNALWMFLKKEHFNPIHIDRWRVKIYSEFIEGWKKEKNKWTFNSALHFHNLLRSTLSRTFPIWSLLGKHFLNPSDTLENGLLLPVTSGSSSWKCTRGTSCGLSWLPSCLYTLVPPMKALGCGTDGTASNRRTK